MRVDANEPNVDKAVTMRLSKKARLLLVAIEKDTGIKSDASIVELALRDLAKARGIQIPEE